MAPFTFPFPPVLLLTSHDSRLSRHALSRRIMPVSQALSDSSDSMLRPLVPISNSKKNGAKNGNGAKKNNKNTSVIDLDQLVKDRMEREKRNAQAARAKATAPDSDSDSDSDDSLLGNTKRRRVETTSKEAKAATEAVAAKVGAAVDDMERIAREYVEEQVALDDGAAPRSARHVLSVARSGTDHPKPPPWPTLGDVFGTKGKDANENAEVDQTSVARALESGVLVSRLLAAERPVPESLGKWLVHNALYGTHVSSRLCANTVASLATGNPCARASSHFGQLQGAPLLQPSLCAHQRTTTSSPTSTLALDFLPTWSDLIESLEAHGLCCSTDGGGGSGDGGGNNAKHRHVVVHPQLNVTLDLIPIIAQNGAACWEGANAGTNATRLLIACMRVRLDDVAGALAPSAEAAQMALLDHAPRALWYGEMLMAARASVFQLLGSTSSGASETSAAAAWHVEALLRRGVPSSVHRGRELQLICLPRVILTALQTSQKRNKANGSVTEVLGSAAQDALEALGDVRNVLERCEKNEMSYWGLHVAMRAAHHALSLHLLHAHGVSPHTEYQHDSSNDEKGSLRCAPAEDGWPAPLENLWINRTPLTKESWNLIHDAVKYFEVVEKRVKPNPMGPQTLQRVKGLAARLQTDWTANLQKDEAAEDADDDLF